MGTEFGCLRRWWRWSRGRARHRFIFDVVDVLSV
jgi:hypothetical protein